MTIDFSFVATYFCFPPLLLYVVLSWIHHLFLEHCPSLDHQRRTVLVTGCASGIGQQITRTLLANNDIVLGLDLHKQPPTSERQTNTFHYYSCDISNPTAVASCATKIAHDHGRTTINAIVNCAGINRGGPLVEMSSDHMESILAVNVLGSVNITRSFFPLLSACRPTLIYISSEVGYSQITSAFNTPYSMSKICLESYVVGLRQEMSMLPHPPQVVVVNPGAMKTPLLKDSIKYGFTPRKGSRWSEQMQRGGAVAVEYMKKHGQDPIEVAKVVWEIVHDEAPKRRYLVGVSWEMRLAGFCRNGCWITPRGK